MSGRGKGLERCLEEHRTIHLLGWINTFEDDLLLPMTKESLNPAVNVSSDPIKVQFVEQSGMGHFVEGFLEV